jgi:hypothetical protein
MLGVIAIVVVAVRQFRSGDAPPPPEVPVEGTAAESASAAASSAPPRAPRCTEAEGEGFTIGEPPKKNSADADAGEDGPEDENAPFAIEIGSGTTFDGGFALGALRDSEGGTQAMLATVDASGKNGKLVKLARARSDLDPPVVTGAGASVLVAMLEPNAGGRAVKLAKVTGSEVAWGPEFSEGKDESMALDLAASGARAAVAWDDLAENGKVSAVFLASFDVATLGSVTAPRITSSTKVDADSPRVVARPGGFWLGWLARGDAEPAKKPKGKEKDKDKDSPKEKAKKEKEKADENSEEVDTDTPAGEETKHGWVEVVPLDESGAPTSAPRAVTPKDGNVQAFDMKIGAGGAALVAYRDDDSPTGSSGGRLGAVLVKPDGAVEPHPYKDEVSALGAPTILPGWLALSGLNGRTYLAALAPTGELLEPLEIEPVFGNGQPRAAKDGTILVAKPAGKSMRLMPLKCAPPAAR